MVPARSIGFVSMTRWPYFSGSGPLPNVAIRPIPIHMVYSSLSDPSIN